MTWKDRNKIERGGGIKEGGDRKTGRDRKKGIERKGEEAVDGWGCF